jgi:hypothetical protein
MENKRSSAERATGNGDDWRSHIGTEPQAGHSSDLARAREPDRGRDANTPEQIRTAGRQGFACPPEESLVMTHHDDHPILGQR